jgi:hypothetical protein
MVPPRSIVTESRKDERVAGKGGRKRERKKEEKKEGEKHGSKDPRLQD